MKSSKKWIAILLFMAGAGAQPGGGEAHIGYLYPAGGRQESTFEIIAGGQFLRGMKGAYITGDGVSAEVVKYYRPLRNLNGDQRRELARRMFARREELLAALPEKERDTLMKFRMSGFRKPKPRDEDAPPVKLPDHPLIDGLETKNLRELMHLADEIRNFRKRQQNAQIAAAVRVRVTIAPDAAPGFRELRLLGKDGMTNPMAFHIGTLPEAMELEPNDPEARTPLKPLAPLDIPVLLNGQVKPGDADRWRFRAEAGQKLVIAAHARRLVPYLADAVPGWFQATLALYDSTGREVAFADDHYFHPDPVLVCEVPENGVYTLEIRDAIYRGRDDFVYRVSIGEGPFITSIFPAGGRQGEIVTAELTGWNLEETTLSLDTGIHSAIHSAIPAQGAWAGNEIAWAAGSLPELLETEPNDTPEKAQPVTLPCMLNGRAGKPGDTDYFRIEGRAGDTLVAEVTARRLRSPLDSLVRLLDSAGNSIAWNDDFVDKEAHLYKNGGLHTHHADSYLRADLPEDGVYFAALCDARNHGGDDYVWRLRLSRPMPDFALRITPATINMPAGRAAPVRVHVLRKDGFDGPADILLKDTTGQFSIDGGRIPAGMNSMRMTLSGPVRPLPEPLALELTGRAEINGETITRPVVPAEDMMQAFLYRHLAPAEKLMVAVTGRNGWRRPVRLAASTPVRIPGDGSARLRFTTPPHARLEDIRLELDEPPPGLSIHDVTALDRGLACVIRREKTEDALPAAANLIIEAFIEQEIKAKANRPAAKQRVSLGMLPAVPCEFPAP
jgi:hypothetical protein